MTDPFAIFRRECEALIKSRVPEPAGYVFEIPPRKELGQLACNVAFQLPKLRKNSPRKIAEDIVAGLDRGAFRLVRDVEVAGPGFINFYRDEQAYARLVLDAVRADGEAYGRGDGAPVRRPLVEHTSVNPNKAWHIGHARNAVLGDTLARLFRFAGHPVEVQNYIDDTGKQVADMIFGLRSFSYLSDDGTLQVPPGRKLDHFFGEVYAELYEVLSTEPDLAARDLLRPPHVGAGHRAVAPPRGGAHAHQAISCCARGHGGAQERLPGDRYGPPAAAGRGRTGRGGRRAQLRGGARTLQRPAYLRRQGRGLSFLEVWLAPEQHALRGGHGPAQRPARVDVHATW